MILTIFGATGDLCNKKLIPALYDLFIRKLLPKEFAIVGVARRSWSSDDFRQQAQIRLTADHETDDRMREFLSRLYFQSTDVREPDHFLQLKKEIEIIREKYQMSRHYLFYLATSPALYNVIPEQIARCGLSAPDNGWSRLVIEKPFGHDLVSARRLSRNLIRNFRNDQIFRIDHYLGKETVQNLLVFRFGNGIFEPLWNRQFISHIEITAVEDMGITGRGGYYDQAGALRDMVQNHLMQLLSLIAMEPPVSLTAQCLHDESRRVFSSLRPVTEEEVARQTVRGQYLAGQGRMGKSIVAYREEPDVIPSSRTETFVALRLQIDNWRWSGVPFYLRTGKAMPTKVSEIVVHFKPAPICLFDTCQGREHMTQRLILRIAPHEGIQLQFALKRPNENDAAFTFEPVSMNFQYAEYEHSFLDAYARLLLDCIRGDQLLFTRSEELEAIWEFLTPIQTQFRDNSRLPLYGYPAGTWGPEESENLLKKNWQWTNPCQNLIHSDRYCLL